MRQLVDPGLQGLQTLFNRTFIRHDSSLSSRRGLHGVSLQSRRKGRCRPLHKLRKYPSKNTVKIANARCYTRDMFAKWRMTWILGGIALSSWSMSQTTGGPAPDKYNVDNHVNRNFAARLQITRFIQPGIPITGTSEFF